MTEAIEKAAAVECIEPLEATFKELNIHGFRARLVGAWWYITLHRYEGRYVFKHGHGPSLPAAMLAALMSDDQETEPGHQS